MFLTAVLMFRVFFAVVYMRFFCLVRSFVRKGMQMWDIVIAVEVRFHAMVLRKRNIIQFGDTFVAHT
jgi:hypothetical protein